MICGLVGGSGKTASASPAADRFAPIAADDDWSAYHAKLAAIGEMAQAYGTEPAAP